MYIVQWHYSLYSVKAFDLFVPWYKMADIKGENTINLRDYLHRALYSAKSTDVLEYVGGIDTI